MTDSSIYTVGGTVQVGSGIYIPRQADDQLLELCKNHAFASVLSPRQMGKSSLMMRAALQLKPEGYQSVVVDLAGIGVQASAEQWYLGLLDEITHQLELPIDVLDWWQSKTHLAIAQRMYAFFREVLVAEHSAPVIIFLDEIDTALKLSFTDDFFAIIRALHETRAREPALNHISFVLIGVASPGDLIRDRQRTPFNIGQRVDLTDFTFDEALPFADGLELPPDLARQVLTWILQWTGGHPYLTQRLCSDIAAQHKADWSEEDVAQRVASTFFGPKSDQDNNLQFVRDMLTKRLPEISGVVTAYNVLSTYKAIHRNLRPVYDDEQSVVKSHLKLSGIVRRNGRVLQVRNPIYAHVFDQHWVREHIPINWPKQFQRLAVAALIVLSMLSIALAVTAVYRRDEANAARETAVAGQQTVVVAGKAAEAGQQEAEAGQRRAVEAGKTAEAGQQIANTAEKEAAEGRGTAVAIGKLAQSQALIIQAQAARDRDPEYSLLVALRAIDIQPSDRVTETLRQAYHAFPIEAVLEGPQQAVKQVAFSPDGQLVVIASVGKTVQVREVCPDTPNQCQAPYDLQGSIDEIDDLAISPDGINVAIVHDGGTIGVWDLATGAQHVPFKTSTGKIVDASWSADGRSLLTAGEDGIARIWNTTNGIQRAIVRSGGPLRMAVFNSDGRTIMTLGADGIVSLWNVAKRSRITSIRHTAAIRMAAFSPDGQLIATASEDGAVQIQSVFLRERPRMTRGHTRPITSMAWSPDGQTLATTSDEGNARLWDAASGAERAVLTHTSAVQQAVFSPDSRSILTVGADQAAYVWDATAGTNVFVLRSINWKVQRASWSTNGRFILTVDTTTENTGKIHIWDTGVKRQQWIIPASKPALRDAIISPNGQLAATISDTDPPQVWSVRTGLLAVTLEHARLPVSFIVFSPNSHRLLTASENGTAQLWDADTGAEIMILEGHTAAVSDAVFTADGSLIATGSADTTVRIWDTQTQRLPMILKGHTAAITDMAFSSDGQKLATASADRTARIWDVATGSQEAILEGHEAALTSIAWSSDDTRLVTASQDTTARVWDPQDSAQPLIKLEGHTGSVSQAIFSPDGHLIATTSDDFTTRVWKPSTAATNAGQQSAQVWERGGNDPSTIVFYGHTGHVSAATFGPDGSWILTTGDDGTVRVWGTATGQRLGIFYGHRKAVTSMIFLQAQHNIVTASLEGTLRIYHCDICVETPDLVQAAPQRALRQLTLDEEAQLAASLQSLPTLLPTPTSQSAIAQMPTVQATRTTGPSATPSSTNTVTVLATASSVSDLSTATRLPNGLTITPSAQEVPVPASPTANPGPRDSREATDTGKTSDAITSTPEVPSVSDTPSTTNSPYPDPPQSGSTNTPYPEPSTEPDEPIEEPEPDNPVKDPEPPDPVEEPDPAYP